MKIITKTIEPLRFEQLHQSITDPHSPKTYKDRIAKAVAKADKAGFSHLVIYADREHFANLAYFTGFDPRFEEALLILSKQADPILLVGNEGYSYCSIIPYELDVVLYQSFSLMGQERVASTKHVLKESYEKAGIDSSSRIGLVGWKYFRDVEGAEPESMSDVPHYLVVSLQDIVGRDRVLNATTLLINAHDGLRTTVDVDELAVLEIAAAKTSAGVQNMLLNLKEGMSEIEASSYLQFDGNPLVAHPNVNFTPKGVLQGTASPLHHPLTYGSSLNVGFGYRGSMCARTGVYLSNRTDFDKYFPTSWEAAYVPYFTMTALWYELVRIGNTGKAVVEELLKRVPQFSKLGIGLNPGHLIHSDEWTNSLFVTHEAIELRSGMAIQCDVIANPPGHPGLHIEDGLVLADETLRSEFKAKYPEADARIERRRVMMQEVLGIEIGEQILPLSEIQGVYYPFGADMGTVMAIDR